MNRFLAFPVLMTLLHSSSLAAPDSPLEVVLLRAKNIVIAELLSAEERNISFQVLSDLRGDVTGKVSFTTEEYFVPAKGSQWLLISQGDNRYGEPKQVLGRPMEGQQAWCGWLHLPLLKVGEKMYAGPIFSFCDGDPTFDFTIPGTGDCLDISRVKRLIARFPYNPNINK